MSQKLSVAITFVILLVAHFAYGQDTISLDQQLRQYLQRDYFHLNALIQSEARLALQEGDFQGGRTFNIRTARISLRGNLDGGFFYRIFADFAPSPVLLDAFVGYKFHRAFKISAGAMKPSQTLDFIPSPGEHFFADRAEITAMLVGSREIGIAAEGEFGPFYYFTGVFNGNRLEANINDKFYGIGRLQFQPLEFIKVGISGSYGNSAGTISGNRGPELRGVRAISGADFEFNKNRFYLAAEYLQGLLETVDFEDETELISGYYFTGGFRPKDNILLLARWQNWRHQLAERDESKFTLGTNFQFTEIFSIVLNFDAYFEKSSEALYGLTAQFQMQF